MHSKNFDRIVKKTTALFLSLGLLWNPAPGFSARVEGTAKSPVRAELRDALLQLPIESRQELR